MFVLDLFFSVFQSTLLADLYKVEMMPDVSMFISLIIILKQQCCFL